jgi:very-short-patch-repair endonuclease
MRSPGEALLEIHLSEIPGTSWTPEHRFHPDRQWRFDFAELDLKLAVEVDGGIYSGGRHVKGKGFQADMDKLNEATRLGWRVLRFSTNDVITGKAKMTVEAMLHDQ